MGVWGNILILSSADNEKKLGRRITIKRFLSYNAPQSVSPDVERSQQSFRYRCRNLKRNKQYMNADLLKTRMWR